MQTDALRATLAAHPVLASASPVTLDALAEHARVVTVPGGSDAFRQGDPAPHVFLVASGALEALERTDGGHEVPLRVLGPGEIGGLTSLATGGRRSATLRAREASVLVTIDNTVFLAAMHGDAGLTAAVLGVLGNKVRTKNAQVATLLERTRRDPREVVAFFDTKPYERDAFERRLPDDVKVRWIEARLGRDTARLAEGYPIVCAFVNDDLSRPVLQDLGARGVRLLAMRCAGYNNVDLAAAAQAGIQVVRVPAYSPYAVAEHTIALLLALVRKIHRAFVRVREGNFALTGLVGIDLHGKTAGVVGTGKIGAIVATILRGFGMTVIAHDKVESPELIERGVHYVSLDELFASSDVISLHVPLTPATYHLVDAARLARTRPGVFLINTSRGGLVDASALIEALKTQHVGGAGLDVYEEEGEYFFRDHSDRAVLDDLLARLLTFPNVLVTSHQGFLTREALDNIAEATLASIAEWSSGKPLTSRVVAG